MSKVCNGKTPEEVKNDLEAFLKEVWCIDGEAKYEKMMADCEGAIWVIFQLTDSKRGKFRVGINTKGASP